MTPARGIERSDPSPGAPTGAAAIPNAFDIRIRGGLTMLEAGLLAAVPFLRHGFCTRRGGNSAGRFESLNFSFRRGDAEAHVRANWAALSRAFGIAPERFVTVRQVHGDGIWVIDGSESLPIPGGAGGGAHEPCCDAIVTNRAGIAIGVKTADCVPILIADPERRVVAAIHAGWKGTAKPIVRKVCDVLEARFSCRREDLLAAVGPAIGPCCYEVDAPVREAMGDLAVRPGVFRSAGRDGHWRLDLASANRLQLLEAGVPPARVAAANLCTACRPDLFFSHRGSGGATGRQFNFLVMRDGPEDGAERSGPTAPGGPDEKELDTIEGVV